VTRGVRAIASRVVDSDPAVPSLAEFRAAAREFLDAHLPRATVGEFLWGVGSDRVGLISDRGIEEQQQEVEEARTWRRLLYDHGYGWLNGPPEYGGRGLPAEYETAWQELLWDYQVPSQGPFFGLGMLAPTIQRYAAEPVRARLLPAMYRGDVIACQLFSEPGAGSDLAAISTSAVPEGDRWRVNGQKIWSSGAHYADIGLIICRTDPESTRHKGLTAFLIDMHQPGVRTRPIREATGKASFNEVFLDDAVVRDEERLGEVGAGWQVAMTTMRFEREAISRGGGGAGNAPTGAVSLRRLAATVERFAPTDERVRDALVEVCVRRRVLEAYGRFPRIGEITDRADGSEAAVAKLLQGRTFEQTATLLRDTLDRLLWLDTGEWGTAAWSDYVLDVEGMKVAGGTTEIMKNIVAERLLGLPRS
jgi:alkylation response protein AidB-like acyl-CoA dehydrogenase